MLTTLQKAGALALLPKLGTFDCGTVAILFLKEYGESIDHHEFAYYLDELRSKGLIVQVYSNHDFTQYRLAS